MCRAIRIFINTRGSNHHDFSQEFLDSMEYINKTTDEVAGRMGSSRIKKIHDTVSNVCRSEKMGVKYMQRWEEEIVIREESREEGRASVNELIQRLIRDGRESEIQRAVSDGEYQNRLFTEYGLV